MPVGARKPAPAFQTSSTGPAAEPAGGLADAGVAGEGVSGVADGRGAGEAVRGAGVSAAVGRDVGVVAAVQPARSRAIAIMPIICRSHRAVLMRHRTLSGVVEGGQAARTR